MRKEKPTGGKKTGPRRNNNPRSLATDLAPHIDAIAAEARAHREEHKSEGRSRRFREWLTIILLVATTAGVFWQVYEMVKVYEPIKESAKASRDVADVSRDAFRTSTRAWVGPRNAKVTEPKIGSPLEITVTYQNSGQEPALNFTYEVDAFPLTIDREANRAVLNRTGRFLAKCRAKLPSPGQAVYPTTGFNNYQLFVNPKIEVDQALLDGKTTLIIQGCFTYTTAKEPHHSFFCYFFTAGLTKPESMNICLIGHYAD